MNDFFKFEADFVDSLRCIPMQVRFKLDNCGVKLKLSHWHQFTEQERQSLVEMPCMTIEECQNYREFLQNLIIDKTGTAASEFPVEDNPPWMNEKEIPDVTQIKAVECDVDITVEKWKKLTPLQRFALIKLSRPSHENKNFYPALQEFGLV
ncbi:MAG: nitrate reductase associated protein [Rivularia sp. T60_A2020_040]|nr:nitrate reductase associated protein [Rivularia sp. T60_A2020_040]